MVVVVVDVIVVVVVDVFVDVVLIKILKMNKESSF